MGELSGFSWRVVDGIQKLIEEKGVTDAEVIVRSGIPRNTFYRKMRGETPLNLNDIDAIADALEVDPLAILRAASRTPRAVTVGDNVVSIGDDWLRNAARPAETEPTDEQ